MVWNAIDWVDLVLRWFHVMAGISWIGGSLYLLWLDRILASPERAAKGEHGEPWLINLAGSLLVEKLKLGPDGLVKTHAWFKRETTLTYVSGILLLVMVAQLPGGGLLIGAEGQPLDGLVAAALIAAPLILGWVCYDLCWRLTPADQPLVPGAVSYAAFVALAWGLAQVFSGRAVFIVLGATLGTIMMGNVWFRILPALKEMSEAQGIDPQARMRATHNSYLIFPTVVLMLGNHYPVIYGHHFNWLIIALLAAAFVLLRHVVVGGKAGKRALAPVAALALGAFVISAVPPPRLAAGEDAISFAAVRGIVIERCLSCHSTVPSDRTFGPLAAGIAFDRPEDIKRHAARIKARAADSLTMPNRHQSGMTAAERKLLGRWVNQGARLE